MDKILVTGKNGQLGRAIQSIIINSSESSNFVFVGRDELDLSDQNMITNYFKDKSFDTIINCAAYTEVDKAEEEQSLANQINHLAVSQLAQITKKLRANLIHVSTDYVFDGENNEPYTESSKTNPINVYGKTKLAGEKVVKKILPTDAIIIRTSWVYSEFGKNFVKSILRLGKDRNEINVVFDQVGTPTYAKDLADMILSILKLLKLKKNKKTQIYHYSNKGKTSWYEFAKEILKEAKLECKVNPVLSNYYSNLAKRPKNSLMSKSKIIKEFNLNIADFRTSLKSCISILNKRK